MFAKERFQLLLKRAICQSLEYYLDGCTRYFPFQRNRLLFYCSANPCTQEFLWRRITWNVYALLGWVCLSTFLLQHVPKHHLLYFSRRINLICLSPAILLSLRHHCFFIHHDFCSMFNFRHRFHDDIAPTGRFCVTSYQKILYAYNLFSV